MKTIGLGIVGVAAFAFGAAVMCFALLYWAIYDTYGRLLDLGD